MVSDESGPFPDEVTQCWRTAKKYVLNYSKPSLALSSPHLTLGGGHAGHPALRWALQRLLHPSRQWWHSGTVLGPDLQPPAKQTLRIAQI